MPGSSKGAAKKSATSKAKTSAKKTAAKKGSKTYPCIGDSKRKYSAKSRTPESRGLCARSLPINTVAVGGDDRQWIVMIDKNGEHMWEPRRQPRMRPSEFRDCAPVPTVMRMFA